MESKSLNWGDIFEYLQCQLLWDSKNVGHQTSKSTVVHSSKLKMTPAWRVSQSSLHFSERALLVDIIPK
jgi:hypothetical protein